MRARALFRQAAEPATSGRRRTKLQSVGRRRAPREMLPSKYGRTINMSSVAGLNSSGAASSFASGAAHDTTSTGALDVNV
jgi:hypothetical protein